MKRFLSLILMVALVFTMPMSVSYASGDIEIVSPGASCTTDISEIEVSCSGASKIIFELDGKKIGETSGETVLPLSQGTITAGNHILKVSAVFPDKTAAQKEISFNAMELVTIKSAQQNFDSFTKDKDTNVHMKPGTQDGKGASMPDIGRSGSDGDKSYKLYMTIDSTLTSGSPYVEYTNFKSYGKKGVLTFDFDIKVNNPEDASVNLSDMPLFGYETAIINQGKILTSDVAVKDGWQHMKIIVDYSENTTGKVTFYHDTDILYEGVAQPKQYSGASSYVQFTIKQHKSQTEQTRVAVWLDNFDFKQELYYGLDKFMYSDGSVWSDCGLGAVPAETKALKLMLTSNMDASTINANNVSLYENGSKVNLTDVIYNDSDKSITLIPQKAFGKGSDITVALSNAVKLSGGYAVKGKLEARTTTEPGDLTPVSVSFEKNDSLLISGAQLESGDSLSADVVLNNGTDEPKPMTALVYVRQNRKLRGIGAVETTVAPHSQLPVNVNIPSLSQIDQSGDISVKLVICDTLKNGVAYMSSIEIN